jgi:riboflavin kinase / FMN adenylyltransferase
MRKVYRDVAGPCLTPDGSVVCIGAFDGVHRGHRAVLDQVRVRAEALHATPVAVTFAPIPRIYFGQDVPQLTTVRERIDALLGAGMQHVLLLRFNADFAAMSAEDFIQRVLVDRLAAREVWVGEGFRFGHNRLGDLALLKRIGAEDWMSANVVSPFALDGERVSSSRIRAALAAGDLGAAERLLGRHFSMGGRVVHGEQIGRKLGCPTANLRLGARIAPLGGIFAARIRGVGDQPRAGVASLGMRPTINGTEPLLEAHLFDFDGDLYGKRIEVEFVKKIRNEEKFPDLAAMAQQISRDVAAARIILGVAARARVGVKS